MLMERWASGRPTQVGTHPNRTWWASSRGSSGLLLSRALLASSRLLPVISVWTGCSIPVTVPQSLPALSLADAAVPQQDGSRLCLRGLLFSHCDCGSVHRQQVRAEKDCRLTQKYRLFKVILTPLAFAKISNNFTYEAKHCGVKKIRVAWVVRLLDCWRSFSLRMIVLMCWIHVVFLVCAPTGTCACGTLWWRPPTASFTVRTSPFSCSFKGKAVSSSTRSSFISH